MKNDNIEQLKKDIVFEENLRGYDFEFHTTLGLFSPKTIDEGSKLLIDQLEVKKSDVNLDVGCGYGPIGLVLARPSPGGVTHLVDKDFVAVEYTKKNAEINNLKNCEVYLSNGLSRVPNIRFDNIVANLPSRVGNELLNIIINDVRKWLKEDGKLYVVTISRMRDFIKRSFKQEFGNYKKLKQGRDYTVVVAVKSK